MRQLCTADFCLFKKCVFWLMREPWMQLSHRGDGNSGKTSLWKERNSRVRAFVVFFGLSALKWTRVTQMTESDKRWIQNTLSLSLWEMNIIWINHSETHSAWKAATLLKLYLRHCMTCISSSYVGGNSTNVAKMKSLGTSWIQKWSNVIMSGYYCIPLTGFWSLFF